VSHKLGSERKERRFLEEISANQMS
jgi:hypothetical protein